MGDYRDVIIHKLREALKDTDDRLINHHNMNHIVSQRLGKDCVICTKEPNVFVRNKEVMEEVERGMKEEK